MFDLKCTSMYILKIITLVLSKIHINDNIVIFNNIYVIHIYT